MIRLYSEYDSKASATGAVKKYRIEIHDLEYSGSSTEIKCEADGLVFKRESGAKDFPHFVMPTSVEVSYLVTTPTQLAFFEDLGTINEDGLFLKITDRVSSDIIYIGRIIPDLIRIADNEVSSGIPVTIEAVDGLSQLKDRSYIESQANEKFGQLNPHKMASRISTDKTYGSGASSSTTLFDEEVVDTGNRFNVGTGVYTSADVAGTEWRMTLIINAKPSQPFEDVTAKILKNGTDVLAEQRVSFATKNVAQIMTINLRAEDVDLVDGDEVSYIVEWQDDWHFLTFKEGSRYYNVVKSSRYNIENVYDKVEDHLLQLLLATGMDQMYDPGDFFLRTITQWSESSQSSALCLLSYIMLPYNAFVTDFERYPVETMSCYDCLYEICKAFGAFLTYEDGMYQFIQYDSINKNAGIVRRFVADKSYVLQSAFETTSTEPKRLTGGSFTYLPSVRELIVSSKRWNTPNFLFGANLVIPNIDEAPFLGSYTKSGSTVYFKVRIRFYDNPEPTPGYRGTKITHGFKFVFKIGSEWMKFDQLFALTEYGVSNYPGTSLVPTTWEGTTQVNTMLMPFISWTTQPPYELEVIGQYYPQASNSIFDAPGESGDIEFYMEYIRTYYVDSSNNVQDTVLDIDYDILELLFTNNDVGDNIISEQLNARYTNSSSTKRKEISILFNESSVLDNDPYRLQVLNGGDLTDPSKFSNEDVSLDYQQFVAHRYAAMMSNRLKIYLGRQMVDAKALLSKIETEIYLNNKMDYLTVFNEQGTQFIQIKDWDVAAPYDFYIGETKEISAGGGSADNQTTGGSGPSETVIIGAMDGIGTDQLVPDNFDVADLDGYSDYEINAKLTLQVAGIDYHYPTHFTLIYTPDPGYIKFTRPIQTFELVRWKLKV